MSAVGFDTHGMVNQPLAAGFTGEQAEAVTVAVRSAQDGASRDLSGFATKADLQAEIAPLKVELTTLKVGLAGVRADFKSGLAETKAEIFKVMLGQTLVIVGAVVTLVKLIGH